jgi:hypothetical protein
MNRPSSSKQIPVHRDRCTSLDLTRDTIERFLASSKDPVLLEPGTEPVRLLCDNWALDFRSGRLTLQAWDEAHNIVRRLTSITNERPGRVEFAVERFGKRNGTVLLIDRKAARNHESDVRAARLTFRETFRRALRRQFPDWRLAELSTEKDLEHSLSPTYPRAFLRKGTTGWAAIAAAPDCTDPAAALTFGLIWLDYLRRREQRVTVEGLALFLPLGRERVASLRLKFLNPRAAKFLVFVHDGDFEERVDLADYGNLDTKLSPCTRPSPGQPTRIEKWMDQVAPQGGIAERIACNDGSVSLRVRGLEFARATHDALLFGLETVRSAAASNLTEIHSLAAELNRMRSPHAANTGNPLYSRNPECWLESQVRSNIQEVDATLMETPVYGQVPAFTAGDRDVIDLLAVDHTGRLTVMELKASEDIHLPFQGLDYWMRVKWHADRDEFAANGYFPGIPLRKTAPRLLLIAPALDFHPANEVVLRYFSPDIPVERIGAGLEWRKQLKVMFRY